MAILDIIGAAAGGGVFGVLGTIAGRVAQYYEHKQRNAHEAQRWQHEKHLLELQMRQHAQETEHEILIAQTEGSYSGLAESLRAEAAINKSYKWVDAVRALTRPVLTMVLWALTALVWVSAGQLGLHVQIAETITFAATAATLWWFGDRATYHQTKSDIK